MRALGLDVSLRRGLDAVLLDGERRLAVTASRLTPADVPALARGLRPDVVCIDSPPAWARSGRSRAAERRLASMGIRAYATPTDPGDHHFYAWMAVGHAVYAALRDDYPLYRGGDVAGHAAEVFPHATAVLLAGRLPGGLPKLAFRSAVLRHAGIDTARLRTQDLVDAALAALTGIVALRGDATGVGDPEDGVLLLPGRELPLRLRAERGGDASGAATRSSPAGAALG